MDGGEGVAAGFFETPSPIPNTETGACNAAGARPRFVRCNGIQRAQVIDQMTARNSKTTGGGSSDYVRFDNVYNRFDYILWIYV